MVKPSPSIASQLGQLLIARKISLSTAESCTGGLIASTLCAADDTPLFYAGGFVTFNDQAKTAILGVRPATLEKHTAVSRRAVEEMVTGARLRSGADVSVAVSGYAGPEGGTDGTPAGTVWFAWQMTGAETMVKSTCFTGDAQAVICQATDYALAGVQQLIEQSNK
ncbi:2-oxo-tetronate isomerase [Buttiauxella warmboldiae]|uniref:2-oxo-tetronate isomerase n=1 Tax=Buttiauxella warmboldiae TaxID=82993 RepID=A0A3N5DRH4_9ENTR|nr:2-oxo-tetronate isomerase [Buttiauxella warmboldiae]RPH30147.1 2-oxo-tetronate isomerase [Buttiauxella warmboldiae]